MEFEAWRPELAKEAHDIIIIGSGISGLTAAAVLTRLGRKVTILEQHYVPGGATHVFKRKGHEWNTGLHYLGQIHDKAHPFRKAFDFLTDGDLNWGPRQDNYDRFFFPDKTYVFPAGFDAFRDEILTHFPHEKKGIDQYLKLLREVKNVTRLFGVSRVFKLARPFVHQTKFPSYFYRSTDEVFRTLFTDPKLMALLAGQFGNYGLPPKKSSFGVHALVAEHYMGGSSFPTGGSGEIAKSFGRAIRKRGGRIVTRALVEEILTDSKGVTGVRMRSGDVLRANIVISTAGQRMTREKLLKKESAPSPALSPAYMSMAVGIDLHRDQFNYDGANAWIHPSYDIDRNVDDYFTGKTLTPAVTYISFPFLKDKTWETRVGTKVSVDLLGLAPASWFSDWKNSKFGKRPEDYEARKEELAGPYLREMYRVFPEFTGKLEHLEISSPLTSKHYFMNVEGETYGLASTPDRFRPEEQGPWTDVKGLYLSGQDTLFIGLYGAMVSGILTAGAIHPIDTLSELWPTGIFEV